jgi:hypothetical protein
MSRGVRLILVTRPEIVVLPTIEPTVAQGVHVVFKVKYSEPKLNQWSGNIVRRVSRD